MKIRAAVLFAALSVAGSMEARADDPENTVHRVYAKPVVRTAPRYPSSELNRGRQGWVILNYVVSAEGEVLEPVVEESSGSRAFERAAIRTVEDWTYEPATLNGEPIQQCKTKVMISFALDGQQGSVSRRFRSAYVKLQKMIQAGDLPAAEPKLDAELARDDLTLTELSWLWTLKSEVSRQQGDKQQQLFAARRALASKGRWLPEALRENLLVTRAVLEIESGDYSSAKQTYSRLSDMESADTSGLAPFMEQIDTLVASDQLFYKDGQIGGNENCESCESQWQHKPLRRAIELDNVEGELGNVEFRCDWQRFVDEAREGVTWTIPESWGNCAVVLHGEPGSSFRLYEIPAG